MPEPEETEGTEFNSNETQKQGRPELYVKALLSRNQAIEKITGHVRNFGWRDFSFAGNYRIELVFIPFYVFHFDVFRFSKDSQGHDSITDQTSGKLALDAVTNELSPETAKLFGLHESLQFQEKPLSMAAKARVLEPLLSAEEATGIIRVRLASRFNVQEKSILVSGMSIYFAPFYRTTIIINDEKIEAKINAFNGNVSTEKEIPEREKNFGEIIHETFDELRNPASWFQMAGHSVDSLQDEQANPLIKGATWIVILLIIAVIILFFIGFGI